MTERNFRKKWMGYDPAQVDHACLVNDDRVRSVSIQLKDAESKIATLSDQLIRAERGVGEALKASQAAQQQYEAESTALAESASYAQLGRRVAQILSAAEAEAVELRSGAEQAAAEVRADADLYAEEVRIVAEDEGAKAIEEARTAAAEERRAAESDAIAMRTEAANFLEAKKADAARAAAELETFLADRREMVVAELEAQQLASHAEFEAAAARSNEFEATLVNNRAEADKRIALMLEEAQQRAEALIVDARAAAERVRTESERELLAVTRRRDSINAQVANARETFVALTGATSPEKVQPDAEAESVSADSLATDATVAEPSAPETSDSGVVAAESSAGVVPMQAPPVRPKGKPKSGLKLVSSATLTPKS